MRSLLGLIPRVLAYVRPYSRLAVGSAITTALLGFTALLAPWPLQILVDHVLENKPMSPALAAALGWMAEDRLYLLGAAVAAGLAIALLDNGVSVLAKYFNTRLEQGITLDFRSDLFQHAQRLSQSYHDQRRAGQTIFAVNFQAKAAANLVMTLPPLAKSLITLVGMVWIVFSIDPKLAFLSLSVVPFLYYSIGYYTKHIESRLRKVRNMEGETLSIIHEALSMLRVIVAFGREPYEFQRFRAQGERAMGARVNLTLRQTLFSLAVNMTTALGTALVLGYGAYRVLEGQLTVGKLLVVMAYLASVYQPLQMISTTIGSIQEVLIRLQLSMTLLDTEPAIQDSPGAVPIAKARGEIAFERVHFHYKGRMDTLADITFRAVEGQVTALVGPTGAGKSTLVSLISRIHDPSKGTILLDGVDIRKFTLQSLRRQISVVHQEPMLFSGTIEDNIRYGRLDAESAKIVEAAKAAGAHEFIMRMPKNYDARVGEKGVQLSVGERQRICIARAFLKDSPILILDEPTSAVDSRTEALILQSLEWLMKGRSTIVIAHRLSTIRSADLILVLQQGRIVDRGTHAELFAGGGLYRQLYEAQAGTAKGRVTMLTPRRAAGANSP
jgi:ATP-binding cassette, subfamily B, bacterial